MLHDLAVLTPSAVVCAAFIAGVIYFLRRQMGPVADREQDAGGGPAIRDEGGNAGAGEDTPVPSPQRREG